VDSHAVVYGVSTGFGQLASVSVPAADAARLQVNLLRSHAVGAGRPLDEEVVRASRVIATELVCACQGIEFHRPLHTTPVLEQALAQVRGLMPRVEEDRSLAVELSELAGALRTGRLAFAAAEEVPA
jgi:histidine ammonia-lyase